MSLLFQRKKPATFYSHRWERIDIQASGIKVAKITSNIQTKFHDWSQANEVQFDCVTQNNWPLKISILSTYRNEKLIYVAVQSWAFPGSLKEYLFSFVGHIFSIKEKKYENI